MFFKEIICCGNVSMHLLPQKEFLGPILYFPVQLVLLDTYFYIISNVVVA